jgi:hypothetical protein
MAATADDVRCLDFTNTFKRLTDAQLQCIIDTEASLLVSESAWGDKATQACALIAAHIATISIKGVRGPAGPVLSESAGGLSRTYGSGGGPSSSTSSSEYWKSTTFGQRYLRLRACLPLTPLTLSC